MKQKKIVIIGGGLGALATACFLAKDGYEVVVLEKNEQVGGRASVLHIKGYRFDMGPSWYMMPDVFDHFFEAMGEKTSDHLQLQKLSPSYRIYFDGETSPIDMWADSKKDAETFESIETGAGATFVTYMAKAKEQYEIARDRFIYKEFRRLQDFFTWEVLTRGSKLRIFSTMHAYVSRFFSSEKLQKIMQYTLVFLGGSPYNTPALYSMMGYVDLGMGVYYPKGGIYALVDTLKGLAERYGAVIRTRSEVKHIFVNEHGEATGVELMDGEVVKADIVISNADLHHTETVLLDSQYRTKSEKYWQKRVMSPSAFMLYLGIDGHIDSVQHHTLYFSDDWQKNFSEIFDTPQWPDNPSLYVCVPSKTDATTAPAGKENMMVLVPIASGLQYTEAEIDAYEEKMLELIEKKMGIPQLRQRIEVKERFCVREFQTRYNSYQGSALGLAHTLSQSAIFRPGIRNKHVKNLFYVGANVQPGIGMPMCLIGAELVHKAVTELVHQGQSDKK